MRIYPQQICCNTASEKHAGDKYRTVSSMTWTTDTACRIYPSLTLSVCVCVLCVCVNLWPRRNGVCSHGIRSEVAWGFCAHCARPHPLGPTVWIHRLYEFPGQSMCVTESGKETERVCTHECIACYHMWTCMGEPKKDTHNSTHTHTCTESE